MSDLPRTRRLYLWTWAHRFTAAAFLALLLLGNSHTPWLVGTATATRLLATVPFVDPLAGLEIILASHQATATLLTGLAVTCAIAVVLGRVFCGWLCPLGLILDLNDSLRERLQLAQFDVPKSLKYWILGICVIATAVAGVPLFTTFSPINLVILGVVFGLNVELAILLLPVVAEHFSRRLFCRSICPLGAFYCILGRYGLWRVRIGSAMPTGIAACGKGCQRCSVVCPMGIDVHGEHVEPGMPTIRDPECTRCGACVDACPGRVLGLTTVSPK